MKIWKKILIIPAILCCVFAFSGCAVALSNDEIPSALQNYFDGEKISVVSVTPKPFLTKLMGFFSAPSPTTTTASADNTDSSSPTPTTTTATSSNSDNDITVDTALLTTYCDYMKNKKTYDLPLDVSEWDDNTFETVVDTVVNNNNYTPSEKLYCETLVFGMQQKILDWMDYQTEISMWMGEEGQDTITDDEGNVIATKPVRPASCEGHTDEEMQAMIDEYYENFQKHYKPTGKFGDPIN